MYSLGSKTSIAMSILFSNVCSLNKLPIRPLLLFKSSSRKFSIIFSPNTRNAGLFLEHNFSGIPTNKLGHLFARNHCNEFTPDADKYFNEKKRKLGNPEHESHAPDPQLGNGDDDTVIYSNNSTLSQVDSLSILRQHREVQGAFDSVKATLLPILRQKLKNVRPEKEMVTSGLETAASIDLLRLFGSSSHKLDEIGTRALQGARMLAEGHKKVNNGEEMLKRAFDEIRNHLE